MLETIVRQQVVFYFVGAAIAIGMIAKLVAGISLKRLVRAASNMGKSNHALMRLVRAKFEHACMVSDSVQNVGAFVEKYLYEYRTLGIRLYSWRQMEKTAVWMCGVFAAAGTVLAYYENGPGEMMYRSLTLGALGAVSLFLLYMIADERHQLDAAKMYMVDFLENTYAHRYRKTNQREIQVTVQQAAVENEVEDEPEQQKKERKIRRRAARKEAEYWEPEVVEASCRNVDAQEEMRREQQVVSGGPYQNPGSAEVPYREPQPPEVPYREPRQPEVPYRDIPTVPDPMIQPPNVPGQTPPNAPGQIPPNVPDQIPLNQTGQMSLNRTGQIPPNVPGQMPPVQEMPMRGERTPEMEGRNTRRTARVPEGETETQAASSGYIRVKEHENGEEENMRKEARIREILEEFLA